LPPGLSWAAAKASRRASQEEKALEAALGPLQAPADPQKIGDMIPRNRD